MAARKRKSRRRTSRRRSSKRRSVKTRRSTASRRKTRRLSVRQLKKLLAQAEARVTKGRKIPKDLYNKIRAKARKVKEEFGSAKTMMSPGNWGEEPMTREMSTRNWAGAKTLFSPYL